MQIKNIMTTNVATVQPDDPVSKAANIMKKKNVGAVPVCQGNKPVGIITDRDLSIRALADGKDQQTPVKNIMSTDLVAASPDMSTSEAARLMAQNQVRRLPVNENNNLQGIVSLGDLAVEAKSDTEVARALSSISYPARPE